MRKRTIDSWKRQIERRMVQVGKLRDKIRDDVSNMEDLRDSCDQAHDDLQRAIDALSELA